jgi:tetratricopeptide (TPR) repeat protein
MLSPDDIKARQELGLLYSRLGKPEEAADHFKWVIDRLLAREDHEAALEVCRKMTLQNPSDPHGHYQRASILLSQDRLEEALPAIEKAAQLFLEKGDPLRARDVANLGLRHFPSSAPLSELLEAALEATRPVAKAMDAAAAQQEEEFSEWISSLEDEITAAPMEREPVTTGFVSRDDLRVLYFRDQIEMMNEEQLASMEKHLKTMYSDIQELYQKGLVESQEVRTVKQFYRAFCIALEQFKRMR